VIKIRAHLLFVGQLIAQLMIFPALFINTIAENIITIMMYLGIVTLGISVCYHRYLSHSMFKLNRFWQFVTTLFAHVMMVGSAIEWVSQHREHHKFTDTSRDPHSPKHHGWFRAHFLQTYSIPSVKYALNILRLPEYRFQHRYYWHIMFVWAMLLWSIDPYALVYAWLAPAGLAKIIGSLIFSYSHRGGQPRSDSWVGYITGGEGWHLAHHTQPNQYRWHQYDFGAWIIDKISDVNTRK
jgi:stearoyl-CoA desaturase (Delta-9 desaturase)